MVSQTVLSQKKRRGPAPTGKGKLIGVRLQPTELAAVDDWRDRDNLTRPEAIRRLIGLGLTVKRNGRR
jgi:hypothetical protein